jgi:hypothetical protein
MNGEEIIKKAIVEHVGPIIDDVKLHVDSTHDYLIQELNALKFRVQQLECYTAPQATTKSFNPAVVQSNTVPSIDTTQDAPPAEKKSV